MGRSKKIPNKLKIAILIDQLVSGGVQKAAIEEACWLQKFGHKVTLFILIKLNYQYQYDDLLKGLNVVYLSEYNPWPFNWAIFIPFFSFLTSLHILSPFFVHKYTFFQGYDFIISHGTTTCITAASISNKFKIPYLAFVWDPMIYILEQNYRFKLLRFLLPIIKPIVFFYEKAFLDSAAIVATGSKVHQMLIEETYFVKPLILHPALSIKTNYKKSIRQYILGYTRWDLGKNPELFLYLAKKIPKISFLIAGVWNRKDEEVYFKEEIKRLGLEHRIQLKSPLPESELKDIASKSIVWLHPNFEGFGMGGLEMAALGLPIIIPKDSGLTELFEHGKHGFFPNKNDTKGFLKYTKYLVNNPKAAEKMGTIASKIAKQHTWKKHTKEILRHLLEYQKKIKLVCLSNSIASTQATGGGDRLTIELINRVPNNVHITVLLPKPGLYHFQKAQVDKQKVRFLVLHQNFFDNTGNPFFLLLAYLIRSVQAYILLHKLPPFSILYSATDFIPDSIPAFFYHKTHASTKWVNRFFHFIESPKHRLGHFWINFGAFLLQQTVLKLIKNADMIMVDNPHLVYGLIKKDIRSDRIKLHLGGVDISEIHKVKSNRKFSTDGLIVGRLQPHKGIYDAIDIWRLVVQQVPNAKLTMIGFCDPGTKKHLDKKIVELGLTKNIILTGYIDERSSLLSYYRSAKLQLFLDHEAGFGLVVAEAMAAGLPVIAFELSIFGSVYKNGFKVVKFGEYERAANHIIELLKNPKKRSILSMQATEESYKFDWTKISKKFYQELTILHNQY